MKIDINVTTTPYVRMERNNDFNIVDNLMTFVL